jgi:hypothetical protein
MKKNTLLFLLACLGFVSASVAVRMHEEEEPFLRGLRYSSKCPRGPGVTYVKRTRYQCVINFLCIRGKESFYAPGCGCGCKPVACGGFAGTPCPDGLTCVDDIDSCDPNNGPAKPPHDAGSNLQWPEQSAPPFLESQLSTSSTQVRPFGQGVGADCSGKCFYKPVTCGGFAGTSCPTGLTCVDDVDSCDSKNGGADCSGHCKLLPASCGGFAGTPCPNGLTCVDDIDNCDPNNGGTDCSGHCEYKCGGFAGITCPNGLTCVDDIDSCDPKNGGADCSGHCK